LPTSVCQHNESQINIKETQNKDLQNPLYVIVVKPGLYLNETSDVVTDIKIKRLEGLVHLTKKEINKIPKVAIDAKLKGKKKVGRPSYDGLMTYRQTLK
jgi:hypothetical protein